MPVDLLVEPRATFEHVQALRLGNPGAIVIDPDLIALGTRRDAQPHLAIGPFASVIQQIAEQFQDIFAVPGQQQPRRHITRQQQAFAMNHPQRRQQSGQLGVAIELRARQRVACQACPIELARQALLDLFELLTHLRTDLGQVLEAVAGRQAEQYRQWRLQCMPQVAQGIA
ncbi:hypothetical protein D9M71_687250 [compost metagenome]